MREILFRGKQVGNGEWIKGYYVFQKKRRGTFGQTVSEADFDHGCIVAMSGEMHEVVPDTVGQYTGLKDKHGKRIFEGDCFKTYCTGFPVYRHIVRYYPEHFAFMARCIERNTVHYLSDYSPSAIEVIGNIHDNPELLEREHNG